MASIYSLFDNLNSSKHVWAVKSRAIRTYFQPKFEYPKEIEKIMHDESGDEIHASKSSATHNFISPHLCKTLWSLLKDLHSGKNSWVVKARMISVQTTNVQKSK
ncbi:hypothetical protein CASFOL_029724 [Castilleja foliolosa]|uniref:Uncharacterized protein n=1 Tax=Castilleja foliolosa TaxID=1961234 RepID=A0ABD3C8M7_9LAMI